MTILHIPITKAGNKTVSIDTEDPDQLPASMYLMALEEGLKVILNKGMSKVGALKDLSADELEKAHAKAMEIAEANLTKIKNAKVTKGRTTASSANKVAGVVMTEARRLAKAVVKDELRAAGIRISMVEATEITKLANEMLANDPTFVEQATANLEARAAKVSDGATDEAALREKALAKLAALGGVTESPKLKAKAEKAKAEKPLSAKQAGKTVPRKGSKPSANHHAN